MHARSYAMLTTLYSICVISILRVTTILHISERKDPLCESTRFPSFACSEVLTPVILQTDLRYSQFGASSKSILESSAPVFP